MVITFYNAKGGVGKTSLATLTSYLYNIPILTNDVLNHIYSSENLLRVKLFKLKARKKSLDASLFTKNSSLVCDISSSMSILDPKIPTILKNTDVLVIPTLSDKNSLEVTRATLFMVQDYVSNIHIFVTKVEKDKDFNLAYSELEDLGYPIHAVKKTTLFSRLASDGEELFDKVYQKNGEYQLSKSLSSIEKTIDNCFNVKVF